VGRQTSQQVSSASFLLPALYCSGGVCREEALGPGSFTVAVCFGFQESKSARTTSQTLNAMFGLSLFGAC